jgi:predicted CopG family antitoxin
MTHTIAVSDEVYDYLRGMIDDEWVENTNQSEETDDNGLPIAYRPTFSEVIAHLIEDREEGQ